MGKITDFVALDENVARKIDLLVKLYVENHRFSIVRFAHNIAIGSNASKTDPRNLYKCGHNHEGVRQFLLRRSLAATSSLQELPTPS